MWAVDRKDQCLTGSGANRIEPVAQIREFYANDIAKDAMGCARDYFKVNLLR